MAQKPPEPKKSEPVRPPSGCGDSAVRIRDSIPPRSSPYPATNSSKAEPEGIAGKKAECTPEHKESLKSEVMALALMVESSVREKIVYPSLSPRINMLLRDEPDALRSIEIEKDGMKTTAYQALVECQSALSTLFVPNGPYGPW